MKSATGLVLTCVIFTLVLFVPEKTAALEGDSTGQTFAVEQEKDRRKENLFFRNVSVKGKRGKYEVTGEARPATGQFFYTVEDGHHQYVDETKGETKNKYPDWENFKISISLDKKTLPENGVLILNLYERDNKGEIFHLYPVVLEEFFPPNMDKRSTRFFRR